MTAIGRKQTFDFLDFGASERPLWRKADIQGIAPDFHKIDQLGTSALPSEADIKLISFKRAANDPKRTSNLVVTISGNLVAEILKWKKFSNLITKLPA